MLPTVYDTVYDSVNVGAIPNDARYVLGYVDGRYANVDLLRRQLPAASIVTVTVEGSPAMMADVEKGAMLLADLDSWISTNTYTLGRPWVYCSTARWPLPGIEPASVGWWAADWTGQPHLVPGSIATQYADPSTSGGDYDLSVITPEALAEAFPPAPSPAPAGRHRRPEMILVNDGVTQYILFADGRLVPIDTPADLEALAQVLPGSVQLSAAMISRFTLVQ